MYLLQMSKGNYPALTALNELLSSATGFYTGYFFGNWIFNYNSAFLFWLAKSYFYRIEEINLLEEIIQKARNLNAHLMQILDDSGSYHGADLTVICKSLLVALKVIISNFSSLWKANGLLNLCLVLNNYWICNCCFLWMTTVYYGWLYFWVLCLIGDISFWLVWSPCQLQNWVCVEQISVEETNS
jgi:hypothetical protein